MKQVSFTFDESENFSLTFAVGRGHEAKSLYNPSPRNVSPPSWAFDAEGGWGDKEVASMGDGDRKIFAYVIVCSSHHVSSQKETF